MVTTTVLPVVLANSFSVQMREYAMLESSPDVGSCGETLIAEIRRCDVMGEGGYTYVE